MISRRLSFTVALLLGVQICAALVPASTLILCPVQCDASSGHELIDAVSRALPLATAIGVSTATDATAQAAASATVAAASPSVIFVSAAVPYWRSLASGTRALVVVLDDGRALDTSDTTVQLPTNVVIVRFPAAVIGYIMGVAACSLANLGNIGFLADTYGAWVRAARAGVIDAMQRTCPSSTLHSSLGVGMSVPATTPSIGRAEVLITMGAASRALAATFLNGSCSKATLHMQDSAAPLATTLGSFAWVDAESIFLQQALLLSADKQAFQSISPSLKMSVKVASANPTCCGTPCSNAAVALSAAGQVVAAITDTTTATPSASLLPPLPASVASSGYYDPTALHSGSGSVGLSAALLSPSSASSAATEGCLSPGAVSLEAGGLTYALGSGSNCVVVVDFATGLINRLEVPLVSTIPRGAAFVQIDAFPDTLASAVYHGGIVGSEYSGTCGFIHVVAPGNISIVPTACGTCPFFRAYHSATYVRAGTVFMHGGQDSAAAERNESFWLNFTTNASIKCTDVAPRSSVIPSSRMRHGAGVWNRALVINGVVDDSWIVVSSGISQALPIFDVWLYGLKSRQWTSIPCAMATAMQATNTSSHTASPMVAPLIVPVDDNLFFIGDHGASVYSAAVDSWRYDLGDTAPGIRLTFGFSWTPAFLQRDFATTFVKSVRFSDRAVPVVALFSVTPAACDRAIVNVDGTTCVTCAPGKVKEGSICVQCALRHLQPTSDYYSKSVCWPSYHDTVAAGFALFCIVTAAIQPLTRFATWYATTRRRADRSYRAAYEVSEAVASLRLSHAEGLAKIGNPTRVEIAMLCCLENLKYFRRAMPGPVMRVVDSMSLREEAPAGVEEEASGDPSGAASDSSTDAQTHASGTGPNDTGRRASGLLGASISVNAPDMQIAKLLSLLEFSLRPTSAVVVVFTVGDLPKWADSQRFSELPKRVARLYDVIAHEVHKGGGVVNAFVGDRVYALWECTGTSLMQVEAADSTHRIIHNAYLDRLGFDVHAGLASGNLRSGFVGCKGDLAPPYRKFTMLGPALTEASNLSHAAKHMRLSFLVSWLLRKTLQHRFSVKFVALIKLGSLHGPAFEAGEVVCSKEETESLWDMLRLSEAVSQFNFFIMDRLNGGAAKHTQSAVALSRLKDQLPPAFLNALQHAWVTGKPPQEVVPRAWW